MTIFLIIVHIAVCFILIMVILLQAGRGQGLSTSSFGGGSVQSILGTKAADFLTKATSVAAICFLLTCIGLNILETQKSKSLLEGVKASAPVDLEQIKDALEKIKAAGPEATEPTADVPAEAAQTELSTEPFQESASADVHAVSDSLPAPE